MTLEWNIPFKRPLVEIWMLTTQTSKNSEEMTKVEKSYTNSKNIKVTMHRLLTEIQTIKTLLARAQKKVRNMLMEERSILVIGFNRYTTYIL